MMNSTPPTKEEKARMGRLADTGCRACEIAGLDTWMCLQCSHLLEFNRRRGHAFTICECAYHHQGHLPWGFTREQARQRFGPSRVDGNRLYRDRFGTDDELLRIQNQKLESKNARV